MKKIFFVVCILSVCALMACSFHGKQPKDDAYYKKTQSIDWETK